MMMSQLSNLLVFLVQHLLHSFGLFFPVPRGKADISINQTWPYHSLCPQLLRLPALKFPMLAHFVHLQLLGHVSVFLGRLHCGPAHLHIASVVSIVCSGQERGANEWAYADSMK